jgi:hypothetical protein
MRNWLAATFVFTHCLQSLSAAPTEYVGVLDGYKVMVLMDSDRPDRAVIGEFNGVNAPESVFKFKGTITDYGAINVTVEMSGNFIGTASFQRDDLPGKAIWSGSLFTTSKDGVEKTREFKFGRPITPVGGARVAADTRAARSDNSTAPLPAQSGNSGLSATPLTPPPVQNPRAASITQEDDGSALRPQPVSPDRKSVPLRVIARPQSKLYQADRTESPRKVKPFEIFYVYNKVIETKKEETEVVAYEVGDANGNIYGILLKSDVFEWRQALCLQFAPPDRREQVLLFDKEASVASLLKADEKDRKALFKNYIDTISGTRDGKAAPENFPVVSIEPRRQIDNIGQFYLMPILQAKPTQIGEREGRILEVGAMARASEGRRKTDLSDKAFVQGALQTTDGKDAREANVDIVFCMDLTSSMGQFVENCLVATKMISEKISQDASSKDRIHFGFWGFRDVETIPGIEFDTKNFTPTLQSIDAFLKTLEGVKASKPLSDDYEEDVFTGFHHALTKTAWTADSIKIIVLIGDAPGHSPATHPSNTCRQSPEQLRDMANDLKVFTYAIHIKDPKFPKYHAAGEQDFRTLSRLPSSEAGKEQYTSVVPPLPGERAVSFQNASDALYKQLKEWAIDGTGVVPSRSAEQSEKTPAAPASEETPEQVVNGLFAAAVTEWVGRHQKTMPLNGLQAWVFDKDLLDTDLTALSVKILLTKGQLDSLKSAVDALLLAGKNGKSSNRSFFDELQAVAVGTSVNPDSISKAKTLVETGLVPEFLLDLPYKSQVLGMSNDQWAAMSDTEQSKLLNRLVSLSASYTSLHDNASQWVSLGDNAEESEKVTPVSLEFLP